MCCDERSLSAAERHLTVAEPLCSPSWVRNGARVALFAVSWLTVCTDSAGKVIGPLQCIQTLRSTLHLCINKIIWLGAEWNLDFIQPAVNHFYPIWFDRNHYLLRTFIMGWTCENPSCVGPADSCLSHVLTQKLSGSPFWWGDCYRARGHQSYGNIPWHQSRGEDRGWVWTPNISTRLD